MFKKINEGCVQNSEGFEVKISRTRVTYKSNSNNITMDIEHGGEPYNLIVYRSTYNNRNVTNNCDNKDHLISRVMESFDFLNIKYEII